MANHCGLGFRISLRSKCVKIKVTVETTTSSGSSCRLYRHIVDKTETDIIDLNYHTHTIGA